MGGKRKLYGEIDHCFCFLFSFLLEAFLSLHNKLWLFDYFLIYFQWKEQNIFLSTKKNIYSYFEIFFYRKTVSNSFLQFSAWYFYYFLFPLVLLLLLLFVTTKILGTLIYFTLNIENFSFLCNDYIYSLLQKIQ